MICEHCGKETKQRRAVKGTDKRLSQDREKATQGILNCRTWTPDQYDTESSTKAMLAACEDEAQRLERALGDTKLLWSIFRRNAKGIPYYL